MAAHMKRRKISSAKESVQSYPVKYPEILIYIVERKIQRLRLEHLKKLARKLGFPVTDKLNDSVTHIVSELETRDQVLEILKQSGEVPVSLLLENAEIVSMRWYSSCMEEGAPVEATHEHSLKTEKKVTTPVSCPSEVKTSYQVAKYCCQRITPLYHHNKNLTDALEILEKQANFLGGDQNASRALAFCKASAALKALPKAVRSMHEVENLYDLKSGKHCKRVIQEILEEGFSSEVEGIVDDEWFKTMKIFTGVFGCGAATGRKWYDMKLRTLDDLKRCPHVTSTTEQRHGIELYDDINTPVTRQEAEAIQQIVMGEAQKILPGTTVTITGGFSRGKDTGHDVDLLISHPMEGKEKGLLAMILNGLQKRQFLEYTDVQNSSYSEAAIKQVRRKQTMDHFERCFSIFRLPKHLQKGICDLKSNSSILAQKEFNLESHFGEEAIAKSPTEVRDGLVIRHSLSCTAPDERGATNSKAMGERKSQYDNTNIDSMKMLAEGQGNVRHSPSEDSSNRNSSDDVTTGEDWVARRVDFIIAPQSQYTYALMGWIGSRMFNRSIRDYANKEMNMTLTSHGLFDKVNNKLLPARTQREIFEHLKLDYRKPQDRNC